MKNIIFCIEGNKDLGTVQLVTAPKIGEKITLNFFDNENNFFDGNYEVVDVRRSIEIYFNGSTFESFRCILRPEPERIRVVC